MRLPTATGSYSPRNQTEVQRQLEQADRENHKRGQDVEIGLGRLILTSPNGTRHEVVVANDGTLSASAV